jgi:flagellar basal-body rod protein FlgG
MANSTASALYASRSGLMTHMTDLDVVSNNLANITTVGYKSTRSNFQEMLNQQAHTGIQIRATQMDDSQGAIHVSSKPLDTAISGGGYFAVTLPDNTTAYTRDGEFMLDSAGNLVTAKGNRLVWTGTVPANTEEVKIDPTGIVRTRVGTTWTQAGTISLSRFPNPNGLIAYGDSLFQASKVSGTAVVGAPGTPGFGTLQGYALEESNVNMAEEMTRMISLQKAFQISSSVFQQTDSMIGLAIRMRQ